METTQLYRHYNKDGDLLYVGISLSTIGRLGQHADHSHWFQSITDVKIETFDTRKEALCAERKAIETENPLHNIRHKKTAEKLAIEAYKREKIEQSKNHLLKRYVDFRPLYSVDELAQLLPISSSASTVRKLLESGELGHISITTPRGKEHKYVTGWQLIEYIEHLERESNGLDAQQISR